MRGPIWWRHESVLETLIVDYYAADAATFLCRVGTRRRGPDLGVEWPLDGGMSPYRRRRRRFLWSVECSECCIVNEAAGAWSSVTCSSRSHGRRSSLASDYSPKGIEPGLTVVGLGLGLELEGSATVLSIVLREATKVELAVRQVRSSEGSRGWQMVLPCQHIC